jgi:hypothetical protein
MAGLVLSALGSLEEKSASDELAATSTILSNLEQLLPLLGLASGS